MYLYVCVCGCVFVCVLVGLPRLEKTVNVNKEGTNEHVYMSITH